MKKTTLISIIETILLIAAGILLIMHPGGALNVAVRILGITLLVYAAVDIIIFFVREKEERSIVSLIIGILAIICGIIVLVSPDFIINILPIAAGVIVAALGIKDLILALHMKKLELSLWKLILILSIIMIILGIVIFANPFHTMEMIVVMLGVALIYNAVMNIFKMIQA